jgi:hypothetical protein
MKITDPDHIVWTIATGLLILGVSGLMLAFNYNKFDCPRDLQTMLAICVAYFAANLFKRIRRKAIDKDQ